MPFPTNALVGRESEVAELRQAVAQACAGSGGAWLVRGEPGIGKSRLVRETASFAEARSMPVVWGRAWETGGATPYWPWIQVLRALVRRVGPPRRPGRPSPLSRILPELNEAHAAESVLDDEGARFELWDAASGFLVGAADKQPLCVILEDLHAADRSSLQLLELLSPQCRSTGLLVLATVREAEARRVHDAALDRLARTCASMHLERLSPSDVKKYLTGYIDQPGALLDHVAEVSEGVPLYIVELGRWLSRQMERGTQAGFIVPKEIRSLVEERLHDVPPSSQDCLEIASISGRDVTFDFVSQLGDFDPARLRSDLQQACSAGLLEPIGRDAYRFGHALFQEILHDRIAPTRREALHLRAAEYSIDGGAAGESDDVPWAEVANHLILAGDGARPRAIDAATRAAGVASSRLAFDDAVAWLERALALAEKGKEEPGGTANRQRGELLLSLARAETRAGRGEHGRAHCRRALRLAHLASDAKLLATATLEYGSQFTIGAVDDELVELLRAALDALPIEDGSLRARTLARLASALQPSNDPEGPMEMARESIAMARSLDDPPTLLATLSAGCSALMDFADPVERATLNREMVALARSEGDPVEALTGLTRLVFDESEIGDSAAIERVTSRAIELAEQLGRPSYLWRARALAAMQALRAGDLEGFRTLNDEARSIGEAADDANALRSTSMQAFLQRRLLDGWGASSEELCELQRRHRDVSFAAVALPILEARSLSARGSIETARAVLERIPSDTAFLYADRSMLESLTEIGIALDDSPLLARVRESLEPHRERWVSWGMFGYATSFPVCVSLARIAGHEGDVNAMGKLFEQAVGQAAAGQAPLMHALVLIEWGESTFAIEPESALKRLDEGVTIAEESGLAPIVGRAKASLLSRNEPERGGRPVPDPARLTGDGAGSGREGTVRRRGIPGVFRGGAARPSSVEASQAPSSELDRALEGGRIDETDRDRDSPTTLELDGERWRLSHRGRSVLLRDTKGVRTLASLLRAAGREVHVLDIDGLDSSEVDRGDAGELLDETARRQYRERLRDLEAGIEEARDRNDLGRSERLQAELDFLRQELSRAVGLGGRLRRAGSSTERARVNVQRRLRDVVRRVSDQDATLGAHLRRRLRTGTFCSFEP